MTASSSRRTALGLLLLAWLLFAVATWWIGQSIAPGGANLLLVSIAGSAFASVSAQDARGYCLAVPALSVAFLLILDLYAHPERSRRAQAARWFLVGLLLAGALWSHLLAALVFLLFCGLVCLLAYRRRTAEFAVFGALALALAALSFLPWSFKVLAGIGSLQASAVTWMTPATFPNLLAVFYCWYPFGRIAGPGHPLLDALGAASFLLPLAAALTLERRKRGDSNPALFLASAAGLTIAITFVLLLWLLQRLGVMTVFYAPRYPTLAAELWAAGLAALALWSSQRAGLRRPAAWLLLAPWLLASLTSQVWAVFADRQGGGLREMRTHFAPYLPPAGEGLYIMPSELMPYFRQTFAEYRLLPIGTLPCDLARLESATVLDLNFWHVLDRPRDLVARTILETTPLASERESVSFPDWRHDYAVYRLRGIDRAAGAALCRRGLGPTPPPIPPDAAAVALPENQEYHRGWSFPELSSDLTIRRWASRATSEILFDRTLPPGGYLLHLRGYNPAYPAVPATITVAGPDDKAEVRTLQEGHFALDLPLALKARQAP